MRASIAAFRLRILSLSPRADENSAGSGPCHVSGSMPSARRTRGSSHHGLPLSSWPLLLGVLVSVDARSGTGIWSIWWRAERYAEWSVVLGVAGAAGSVTVAFEGRSGAQSLMV